MSDISSFVIPEGNLLLPLLFVISEGNLCLLLPLPVLAVILRRSRRTPPPPTSPLPLDPFSPKRRIEAATL